MTSYLITFGSFIFFMLGAYLLGRWLTAWSRHLALKWNIVSPVTDRSSHTVPTPRLGGLGLGLAFLIASTGFLLVLWLIPHAQAMLGFNPQLVGWLYAGWLIIFIVGLLDDLYDLAPLVKLSLLVLGALCPTLGGGLLIPFGTALLLPSWLTWLISCLITLFWILFFVNAYNFMDGMDGFAATFARYATSFFFVSLIIVGFRYATIEYIRAEAFVLPILAMACWGFLHWNHPPARVFMGDGGSLSTGYLLAVFPLLGLHGALGLPLSFLGAITILLPFIFDVVLTLCRRFRAGENLLQAHRQHLYQRLMQTGLDHREVLVMNKMRFMMCGFIGLLGEHVQIPFGNLMAFAVALGVMIHYWRVTVSLERKLLDLRV